MMNTVNLGTLSNEIHDMLIVYGEETTEKVKKQAEASMKELVKLTKETAPVSNKTSGKHYRDSIAWKVLSESAYEKICQWYAKEPHHSLTHLLNNGHQLRNGGRWPGTQFLTKAYDQVSADFIKKVEEIYKNG